MNHPALSFLNRWLRVALPGLILAVPLALAQTGSKSPKATPPRTSSTPQSPATGGAAKPPAGADAMGVVDGIPITEAEWDRLAKPYFEEIAARAGRPLNDEEKTLLRRNVLDELIRERLWLADAKRRGIVIPEATIDSRMKQSDFFRTNGRPDEAKFRAFKSSPTSNYATLRGQIERTLLLEEYVRWMERRFGPREPELKKTFEERTSQASIRYFVLGPEAVSLDPEATPAQVRAYYEAHPDEFVTADEARIQYIRVPGAADAAAGDSARAASDAARKAAGDVLAAVTAGAPIETAAKPYGGIHDSGPFRLGEPVRGLGRSDLLAGTVKSTAEGRWAPEPIRMGPYWVVLKVTERRPSRRVPFSEAVPFAKRKADALVQDAVIDSLARQEVRENPEPYYAPRLQASIVARGLDSFESGPAPTQKEVEKRLDRMRKEHQIPESNTSWADSVRPTLPAFMLRERRLTSAMRSMREAASRLQKRESAARVAARHAGVLSMFQLYRGEPPLRASLVDGSFLDSLYNLSPGAVVGPRVRGDSVFVVRVEHLDVRFMPPYAAVEPAAKAAVIERRRASLTREAEAWFVSHRGSYQTPQRWVLDIVTFPRQKKEDVPVSADSIAAYWRARPLEFTEPGRARVHHVLIRAPEGSSRAEARKRARQARERIVKGEDFEAVAREVSEDPSSAAKGGDLGEMTRAAVVKEFADAAFSLPIGAISEPVETRFGVHILRVDERKPERLRPLEECVEEIRGVLATALSDSMALRPALALARAGAAGAPFDSLARPFGGAKRTDPVTAQSEIPGVGRVSELERIVSGLPDGGVAPEPIAMTDGYVVVRRVAEVASQQAEFREVSDRVVADYQRSKRRATADSLNAVVRAALKSGESLESVALRFGGLRTSRLFGREGPIPDFQRDQALARDSTYLSLVFSSKPGAALPPIEGATGTLYAVVDTVAILPANDYAKQRDTLHRELTEQRIDAWTARLRAKATIRMNRRELQSLLS
ncbi:MAG TPA: peptidyl-prolyl cis-trans isomerase [Candidatus Eisenbacteria bacterium]|nr:peptidyl-prolyl cis-trans isomerase [Candidatus Eisenbacteria bacterium]